MARPVISLAVLLSVLLLFSTPAHAQYEWAKKSVITLNDLCEIPGMVLEPGTYVLKTDDNLNNSRAVIQLLNKDESQIITTFIAVPDHRMRPDSDVVLTFFDGVTVGPKPIQTWFYPGEMNGYEFVYPTARAKEIAKHTDDHVMASAGKDAAIVAVTPSGTQVPLYDAVGKSTAGTAAANDNTQREKPGAKRTKRAVQPKG
jgi:hypothetical protein